MGNDNIIPFKRGWAHAPEHFRPEERQAWDDIVSTMAPLHLMEEVDRFILECAAATLASFRTYSVHLDEVTRARQANMLCEVLEAALVPTHAIRDLVRG